MDIDRKSEVMIISLLTIQSARKEYINSRDARLEEERVILKAYSYRLCTRIQG